MLGAASVAAAAEPTVGGELAAERNNIHVTSKGNVPAHVTMSAEAVTLSETAFDINPGETHSLTFTGPKATGTVTALFETIPMEGTETGSAQLSLSLSPGTGPAPSPMGPLAFLLASLAAALLLLRRFRPWQYRLTRVNPSQ